MIHEEEVIRQATIAAANHAAQVAHHLSVYVQTPDAANGRALHTALMALANGYEPTAHDGATLAARIAAAKAALVAWDGSDEETVMLPVGGGVRCLRTTAWALGYEVSISSATGQATAYPPHGGDAGRAVAAAMSEGLRGEAAALRAVAIRAAAEESIDATQRARARLATANLEREAAGMKLAAEREASKRAGVR